MKLTDQIAFQRAIETEAKEISASALEMLILSVNKTFASFSQKKAIIRNLEKLASIDLLSTASAIETISLELAQEASDVTYAGVKILKKDVLEQPSIGGNIKKILASNRRSDVDLIVNETSRLLASGYTHPDVQAALIGTKVNKYQDGIIGQVGRRQETISRTASKIAEQVGLDKARQADPEVIGYTWVSVLDSATSLICMSLSGRKFYYDKSGEMLLPPQHPNCRSSTSDITKAGPVEKPVTFNAWASANPEDAKEAMGPTRYKLFVDGKLKIQRFTDLKSQPLNLEDLKRRNRIAFQKADV